MKVAFINAVYGFASTGLIVQDLEQMLLQQGHETFVAYQTAVPLPDFGMQVGNPADWKWHALMTRLTGRQGYCSKRATRKLIKRLQAEKPDVVHLHNLHSNYIHLPTLFSYLAQANIPTVLTLHDCWFFTGKCFHFALCGCEKWRTGCGSCPQNRQNVRSLFVDATKKVFTHRKKLLAAIPRLQVVGCSDWITELAKASPILEKASCTRIYNGVDTTVFCPGERVQNDRLVIMGMANKWLLPENSAVLAQFLKGMKPNESLLLVGCTEEQRSRFAGNGQVNALPFVKGREELAKLYRSADVFVNLTFEDTLPTVNMEAICCGTPVVTYRSCGSPELVQEGITGFVTEQRNYPALRGAVDQIASGRIDREVCAKIGRERFDRDTQYRAYITLFQSLLEKTAKQTEA